MTGTDGRWTAGDDVSLGQTESNDWTTDEIQDEMIFGGKGVQNSQECCRADQVMLS